MEVALSPWMSRLAELETIELVLFGLFSLLGVLAIVGVVGNFDWFFRARDAKPIVKWLGRGGARLFYLFIGILLLVAAFLGLSGWQP